MGWVAGVDGCKYGWFRVSRDLESDELHFDLVEHVSELITKFPRPSVLALDMPIGLPGKGQRTCDRMARKCLGFPRQNSVFPVPIRSALRAKTREEASAITSVQDGRKVGCQAWGIYPKIREVDEMLQTNFELRAIVREVHPEVCFWAWSNERPIEASKKTPEGKSQRLELAERWLGPNLLSKARGSHLKKQVGDDDILDAVAALWTAIRIAAGTAQSLPKYPPTDDTGLRMEIVY